MRNLNGLVLDLIDSANLGHFRDLLITCGFTNLGLSQRFTIELSGLTGVELFGGLMLNLMGFEEF